MDRRWIAILVILIVGLGCMYYIFETSTSIGSAVTIVDDVSVTLPNGFKIVASGDVDATLLNEATNTTIYMKCLDHKNTSKQAFDKELKTIEKKGEYEITKTTENDTVSTIYLNDGVKDFSMSYFEEYDRTFLLRTDNFSDEQQQQADMMYIIDTLQPDYKQSRE